jgi:hypothetical protein
MTLKEEHRWKVFENRVLRRIFGPKKDDVTGQWRKLHSEELHDLFSLPGVIRMIKLRMSWARYVALMRDKRNAYRLLMGNPKERDHYEDHDIGRWIVLRWILQK